MLGHMLHSVWQYFSADVALPVREERLFYDVPGIALGLYFNFQVDGVVTFEPVGLSFSVKFAHGGLLLQSGVIEREPYGFLDGFIAWIVEGDKGFLLQPRVDVHDAVPVFSVGAAQVDNVGIEY